MRVQVRGALASEGVACLRVLLRLQLCRSSPAGRRRSRRARFPAGAMRRQSAATAAPQPPKPAQPRSARPAGTGLCPATASQVALSSPGATLCIFKDRAACASATGRPSWLFGRHQHFLLPDICIVHQSLILTRTLTSPIGMKEECGAVQRMDMKLLNVVHRWTTCLSDRVRRQNLLEIEPKARLSLSCTLAKLSGSLRNGFSVAKTYPCCRVRGGCRWACAERHADSIVNTRKLKRNKRAELPDVVWSASNSDKVAYGCEAAQ